MKTIRLVLLALAAAASTGASASTVSYGEMAAAARSAPVEAQRTAFDSAAGDEALATSLRRLLGRDELSAVARELLLVDGALRLARVSPTSAGDRLLRELAERPVLVYVAHEHAGHERRIPAYDVAAAARYAIARRAERRAGQRIASAARTGKSIDQTRREFRVAGKQTNAAAEVLAVNELDTATLSASADALKRALEGMPELAPAATAAGRRLDDESLLVAAIENGNHSAALGALHAAASLSTLEQRLGVFDAAIARKDTASAGLNALADAVARDPAQTPALLARLEDRNTAMAAAAAIARLDRPDLAARIADRLETEADGQLAAAFALALSLMTNDTAIRRLDAYLESPGAMASLKDKLAATRPQVQP